MTTENSEHYALDVNDGPTRTARIKAARWYNFGVGYMENSFFAKRLAQITFLILAIDTLGLIVYYYEIFELDPIGCKNTQTYSLLVYHGAVLSGILGLPSTGFRAFVLFERQTKKDIKNGKKIKRTGFLQLCEFLVVISMLYLLVLTLWMVYILVKDYFQCDNHSTWIFAFFALVVYMLIFVQVTHFGRFREHLKMQLGVFKEKDQTGNNLSRGRQLQTASKDIATAVFGSRAP